MQAILRAILIALSLTLLSLVSSFAGPYEDGIEAAERGDYEIALQIFRSLAEMDDAKGQNGLGRMYHEGWGVPQDFAEAVKWYRKSAEQGYAPAQFSLGYMYSSGQGVPQDFAEAVTWYRKAAEQGLVGAQLSLGYMYLSGEGVPRDMAEAADWYHKAAEQGDPDAQLQLGILYARGQGVQQDDAKAADLIGKAAENYHPEAQHLYGYLHEIGVGVQQDPNEAASWYRKAAEKGNPDAQIRLGLMYEHGSGIPQDEEQAAKLYRMAAEKGIPDAQVMLGLMYLDGRGVTKDESEATKWLQKAAQQGHPIAQARLDSLKTGLPVIPTLDQALGVPAQDLAASYLSINEVVSMVALSLESGINVTVNLDDGRYNITQENAASFDKAFRQRLDVYRQAIETRGFGNIAGRYTMRVSASCQQVDFSFTANEPAIRQDGFKTDFVFSADDIGSEAVLPGAITENAVVFRHPVGFSLWGTTEDDAIKLRLNIDEIENALMMEFKSPSDRRAVADCVFILDRK